MTQPHKGIGIEHDKSGMRELLTDKQEEIIKEISLLVNEKTKMTLCQKNSPHHKIHPTGTKQQEGKHILVCHKPEPFVVAPCPGVFLYKIKNQMIRVFQSDTLTDEANNLLIEFPSAIYQIQRRKHPRTATFNSHATLTFKNKQNLYNAELEDICIEGCKLVSQFPLSTKKGDIIESLDLTLLMRNKLLEETKIHVSGATVVRFTERKNNHQEIGAHFKLPEEELEDIERYITMRLIEDSAGEKRQL